MNTVSACTADHSPCNTQENTLLEKAPHHKVARRIAEVIIPHIDDNHAVILPIIASLSQHNSEQWTTWITDRTPSKKALESMGADLSRLRIVHTSETTDTRWITWQALAQGNSHTVIAEQAHWEESELENMEVAAHNGDTRGILITLRTSH